MKTIQLPQFKDVCTKGIYCNVCLRKGHSDIHRASWSKRFDGVPKAGEPCPYGKPWIESNQPYIPQEPAKITVENIWSFIKTYTTGEEVSQDVIDARKISCSNCDYRKQSDAGYYCAAPGSCGCTIEPRKVLFVTIEGADITRYKELSDKPLCLHPDRKTGKGWSE